MFTFQGKEYPPAVTRGEDGVYRWAGYPDHKQKGEVVRIVMGVVGGICLLALFQGYLNCSRAVVDCVAFYLSLLEILYKS